MSAVCCRSAVSRGVCASRSLFDSQLSQRIASILGSSSDLPLSFSSSPSEPLRVTGPAAGRARFHSSSFVGADPSAGSTPSSPAVAGDVAQSPLLPRLRSWFAAPDLTPPPFVGPTGGSEAGSGADGEARGDAQGRGEARMHGEGARGYGDQRVYGRDPRGYGRNFRPRPPVARPKLDLLDKYVHLSLLSAEEWQPLEPRKDGFFVLHIHPLLHFSSLSILPSTPYVHPSLLSAEERRQEKLGGVGAAQQLYLLTSPPFVFFAHPIPLSPPQPPPPSPVRAPIASVSRGAAGAGAAGSEGAVQSA
ncbi:unnamed protein product [Closterium sp. Naga37s-1]|nr:unnamed protein product [Closterium sp. Naga37s-1]